MIAQKAAILFSSGAEVAVAPPDDLGALVALLSAAASMALGQNVTLVSFQATEEYSKFQGWVNMGRQRNFVVSKVR